MHHFVGKTAVTEVILVMIISLSWWLSGLSTYSPAQCFFHVGVFSLLAGFIVVLGTSNAQRLESLAHLRHGSPQRIERDRQQLRGAVADLNVLASAGSINIVLSLGL